MAGVCDICGEPFSEWGNNPWPFPGESCCDACNVRCVIPARFARARSRGDE